MRKVRGFKLHLRLREVQRRARKAKLDLAPLGLAADEALADLLRRFSCKSRPSVLFDSFGQADDPALAALAPLPGLACSLALATLGPDLDAWADDRVRAAGGLEPLLRVISEAALEDATRFVLALIEEEAAAEGCELSPLQYIGDPSVLKTFVERLAGHKIGVAASEEGLKPLRTVAFSLSWLARAKSSAHR